MIMHSWYQRSNPEENAYKKRVKWIVLAGSCVLLLTCVQGCGGSPFSGQTLTTAKAQTAVDKAFEQMISNAAKNGTPFEPGGKAVVEGIREDRDHNSAVVDIKYVNAVYREPWVPMFPKEYRRISNGTAVVTHYNDGRWVLTELRTDDMLYVSSVKTSIEVQ